LILMKCLCSALLYGNKSLTHQGWSKLALNILVATISALITLPASMLLDQLFWYVAFRTAHVHKCVQLLPQCRQLINFRPGSRYRQKLGKKKREDFKHSREMQLMTAAALSSAFDRVTQVP
jgi:hypothetical protein